MRDGARDGATGPGLRAKKSRRATDQQTGNAAKP